MAAGCRDAHGNIIGRGFGINLNEKIKLLADENTKSRSTLKEKTYELEALTHKYRKIQNMVQSGNYLQAVNIVQVARGANASPLVGSQSITSNLPTSIQLTGRSPTQERVSFSLTRDTKSHIEVGKPIEKDGLRKSPVMSSTTQLTTTNTVSSANYTTDLTVDLSSSRMVSITTTSTNGTQTQSYQSHSKSSSSTCDYTAKAIRSDVQANSLNDNGKSRSSGSYPSRLVPITDNGHEYKAAHTRAGIVRSLNKYTDRLYTDSSYCSMGAENEFSGSRRSQDDSKLYNAFTTKRLSRNQRVQTRGKIKTAHLDRWLQGPFCTLMVKNRGQQMSVVPDMAAKICKKRALPGQAHEVQASCPDIAGKWQQSRTVRVGTNRLKSGTRATLLRDSYGSSYSLDKNSLARTLSMIEYLGLDEFNMIAKRHDKLESRFRQRRGNSCCTPSTCSYCNSIFYRFDRPHNCSEGESMFSSSEPLNSGDFNQTGSRFSCSTCCSFNSQFYVSQSELIDESVETNQSVASQTTSASNRYTTQDQSMTTSRSSSPTEDNLGHGNLCKHHAYLQRLKQDDQRHGLLKRIDGTISSSSTSSTSLHPNYQNSLIEPCSSRDTMRGGQLEDDTTDGRGDSRQKFSIKCDILEDL